MSGFFQVFYAIFSGILTSLAIPNEIFYFGSPIFGMVALVPLYIAAKEAKTYKRAALLFGLDALTTHLLSSFWLANFKDFATLTLGASAAGTFCIEAMAGCLYFAPFASFSGNSSRQQALGLSSPCSLSPSPCPMFTVPWFACVRVFYEWAKSTGFLAYPWGTLSMSAFRSKILMQSADIFGVYGITFLFAFIAGTIAETVSRSSEQKQVSEAVSRGSEQGQVSEAEAVGNNRNSIINYSLLIINLQRCSLAMLVCFFVYGAYQLSVPQVQTKTLNAVLVQANKDSWAASENSNDSETINTSMDLTQKGIDEFKSNEITPDIVMWSEAILSRKFPMGYRYYTNFPDKKPLVNFLQETGIPFIIGGSYFDEEKKQSMNAALFFDKEGEFRGYYGKTHLVPFAEAVPGTEYPIVKKFLNKVVGFSNGWTPGQEFTLFDLPLKTPEKKPFPSFKFVDLNIPVQDEKPQQTTARVASPICFEDAFPDICGPFHDAGAEVFLNITDDSWSKTNSAEYQHFVVASFRAIEYRTTLVRSTNAGFTAVVDPCGRVLQSLPLFEEAYLCARVPIYQWKQTVYSRFTNWFVHLIMIFMLAVYCSVAVYCANAQVNVDSRVNVLHCRAKVNVLHSECCRTRQVKKLPDLRECVEVALREIEF